MSRVSRRGFMGAGAGMALGATLTSAAAQEEQSKVAANDKIHIALIGAGGRGRGDLGEALALSEVECLAVCDVDDREAAKGADMVEESRGKRPDVYRDFRRIIERDDIDAVIVGTPDHWHALPTVYACETGKDVYCEKPLATSVGEGRAMVSAARKYDRIVQVGTQQRSSSVFKEAVDFVESGELGRVRMIRSWAYLDWKGELEPKPDSEAPPEVDYDMWLGPAEVRPFNENRFHFNFRWFWRYSGGLMTDWGAHMLDVVAWVLRDREIKSASSVGGKFAYPEDAMETPDTQQAMIDFGDVSVIWEHALGVGRGPFDREHGIEFHGNNGILVVDRGGWEVIPETLAVGQPRSYMMMGRPRRHNNEDYHFKHVQNFFDCVKSRELPNADVEKGHKAANLCHLANIALRTGQTVRWDAEKEEVIGNSDGQALVTYPYRAPWKLPSA